MNNPYGLSSVSSKGFSNTLSNWMFQPLQQNSSGTLPGTTVINVGQNMQINGNNGTIGVGAAAGSSGSNTIIIDGNNDYIVISNPSSTIKQMLIGKLPDGTYGMVVSQTGVDVLSVFN